MVSFVYVAILAALLCWLIIQIVKIRRAHHVKLGDGEVKELIQARAAHSNAVETIPITLLLLIGIEYNGACEVVVHLCGVLFVAARIMHAKGILQDRMYWRKLGMQITLLMMAVLIVLNLALVLYAKISG